VYAESEPAHQWRLVLLSAAFSISCGVSGSAQVLLPPTVPTAAPWNAFNVFEPTPFAQMWERANGEGLAPEDTPVKTRQHAGYEAVGIRAGSWMFYPAATLATTYHSNVFASNTTRRSDLALTIHPSLRANTLWERHSVALQADARSTYYRSNPGLDRTDFGVRGRAKIDLWHDAAILTSFRAAALNEDVGSLSSPAGAVQPTPYTFLSGNVAYRQQLNRLAATVGIRLDSYDFQTTRTMDGSVIDQSGRDGQIYVAHGRLDYAISPKFGVFAAAEINKRNLRGTPTTTLSSDGYRVLTGVNFALGRLVGGEFGAGYARQRFDSTTIGTVAGPAYRALLTWSPSRLVDLRFGADQIVTQASDTTAAGIRASALHITADYELRRNMVLSVAGSYELDEFFGLPRKDNVYASLFEVKYRPNRHGSIALRHRYISRESNIPSSTYDKHEVGINVAIQY
jgi:hypothetical protein